MQTGVLFVVLIMAVTVTCIRRGSVFLGNGSLTTDHLSTIHSKPLSIRDNNIRRTLDTPISPIVDPDIATRPSLFLSRASSVVSGHCPQLVVLNYGHRL